MSLPRPQRGRLFPIAGLGVLLVVGALTGRLVLSRAPSVPPLPSVATVPQDGREAALEAAVRARPDDPAARQELGALRVALGRPMEGFWDLAVARELGRDDLALALQMAGALRAAGLPEAAIAELRAARSRLGGSVELDLALARAYLAAARPEEALTLLHGNRALLASSEGALALAVALDAAGRDAEAKAAIERVRAQVDGRPDLRLALGRLCLQRGELKAARAQLDAAARDRPDDEATLYAAGLAWAAGQSPAEIARAVEYLKRAVDADPKSARAGYELGRLLYEREGNWEKAREIYRQALKIDPQYLPAEEGLARVTARMGLPEALYHRARAAEMTERSDLAVALYRRWGQRRPKRWDAVLRAAECWLDLRRHHDAVREIREGLKRFPDQIELYSHLAQIYLLLNDRSEALRLCDRWAPLDTASGRPERVRGKIALWNGDADGALRWLGEAIRKDENIAAYHADLAEALTREPTPESLALARTALQRAIDLEPANPAYYHQLGTVLQQLGDLENARLLFLRAIEHDSRHVEPFAGLAALGHRLGHPSTPALFARLERQARELQRAEEAARDRLRQQPRDPEARFAVAAALTRRGDLARATHHLRVAVEQRPRWSTARQLLRRTERLAALMEE